MLVKKGRWPVLTATLSSMFNPEFYFYVTNVTNTTVVTSSRVNLCHGCYVAQLHGSIFAPIILFEKC